MRIIIHGATGKTGSVLTEHIYNDTKHQIAALGVSHNSKFLGQEFKGIKYTDNIISYVNEADVIIDFSTPEAVRQLITNIKESNIPLVIGSTGLRHKELELIDNYSKHAKVMVSSNFSIGIKLVRQAINTLLSNMDDEFDIELIEAHHKYKKDAPSGTLLTIAQDIIQHDSAYHLNYGRLTNQATRDDKEIGVSVIRGGNIFGEHQVMFINNDEEITISHQAFNKKIFAKGAIMAAEFLIKQTSNGMFNWNEV